MKKIITAIFCLTLIGISYTHAQVKPLRLGIETSPTFNWMSTNEALIASEGTVTGFNLGLMGQYYFSENYAFSTGIGLAINQGGKLQYNVSGNFWPNAADAVNRLPGDPAIDSIPSGSTLTYHIQYLEIPLGLRLRTNEIGYFRYYAELPIFTLGIKTQGRGDISNLSEGENIITDVNPFNVSLGAGLGAEYSMTENVSLTAGLYYRNSLFDVTRNKDTLVYGSNGLQEESKAIIRNITLRIGVLF